MKKLENAENSVSEFESQKPKGKKVLNKVINVVLVIAICIAAVCTYVSYVSTSGNGVPNIFGIRVFSIQTDSMYPTLKPGDLIFDVGVDAADIKVKDIITYWTVIDGERVLNTHTVQEIYDAGNNTRIFSTKGDNNDYPDPLTVHESEIVGKFTKVKISGLGKVFDYLQTSTGFLIVIVIPVALFFIYHLVQFFRVLFEYQNIKNKLLYEQERGKVEDIADEEKQNIEAIRAAEREKLEAELREKLKQEILAANTQAKPEEPQKTPEEIAAEERAAMEAELRAKIKAELEAEASVAADKTDE